MSAPRAAWPDIFENWKRWILRVEEALIRAHFHQEIWTDLRKAIAERTPEADATFLVHYNRLYADSQMLTIRRVADRDRGAASLGRLLAAVEANYPVVELWPNPVDLSKVREDAAALEARVHAVKTRVDRTVAHLDDAVELHGDGSAEVPVLPPLTYADIRETLEFLGALTNDYLSAMMKKVIGEWAPAIQGWWQEPFRSLFPLDPMTYAWDPRSNGFT